MDGFELTSSLVSALAWPVAVVTLAILFRAQVRGWLSEIARRMPQLTKVSGMGVSAEFLSEQVADAGAKVAHALPRIDGEATSSGTDRPSEIWADRRARIESLAEISPRAAIMEAFTYVESAVRQAVQLGADDSDTRTRVSLSRGISQLADSGLVTAEVADVLRDLRAIRNEAVHSPEFVVPPDVAVRYADSAIRAAYDLMLKLPGGKGY